MTASRLAAALAIALAAGGCASGAVLPLAGGLGTGAGVCFGTSLAGDVKSADTVLAFDAPLKQDACQAKLLRPTNACGQAIYDTYCQSVPADVAAAGVTLIKVIGAFLKACSDDGIVEP